MSDTSSKQLFSTEPKPLYSTAAQIAREANVSNASMSRAVASGRIEPDARTTGGVQLFNPSRVDEVRRTFSKAEVKAAFFAALNEPEAAAEYAALDPVERARMWRHFVTRGLS